MSFAALSTIFKSLLQRWIKEMAVYVKSLDWKHLLEVVLEGFLQLASESEFRQFTECQSRELRAAIRNSLHPQRPAR
jgi:hypothetical protein